MGSRAHFHQRAVMRLAGVLAATKDVPWAKVQIIVDMLKPDSEKMDERIQHVLQALMYFIEQGGGQHWDRLVPHLVKYSEQLNDVTWCYPKRTIAKSIISFVASLVRVLALVAQSNTKEAEMASEAICKLLDQSLPSESSMDWKRVYYMAGILLVVSRRTLPISCAEKVFGLLINVASPRDPSCGVWLSHLQHIETELGAEALHYLPYIHGEHGAIWLESTSHHDTSIWEDAHLPLTALAMLHVRSVVLHVLSRLFHAEERASWKDELWGEAAGHVNTSPEMHLKAFGVDKEMPVGSAYSLVIAGAVRLLGECGVATEKDALSTFALVCDILSGNVPCMRQNKEEESSITDPTPILLSALNVILQLGVKWPQALGRRGAECVRDFLLPLSAAPGLQEVGLGCAARLAKEAADAGDTGIISEFVFALTGELLGKNTSANATNAVLLLGRISVVCASSEVIDRVLPALVNRLRQNPSSLDPLIIEQLTEVAIMEEPQVFEEVIELLVERAKRETHKVDRFAGAAVTNALLRIARVLKSRNLRQSFLNSVLKLFCDIGLDIQQQVAQSDRLRSGAFSALLGTLLPILSQLVRHATLPLDKQMVPHLHNCWLYCVLHSFVIRGQWGDSWYAAVREIARVVPPMMGKRGEPALRGSGIGALLRKSMSDLELQHLRQTLVELLPESSSTLWRVDLMQALHIMAVFHLENLRSEHGSFASVFAYLVDGRTESTELRQVFVEIADVVFRKWLGNAPRTADTPHRPEKKDPKETSISYDVVDSAQFLVFNYCHRLKHVRECCDRFIARLIGEFPRVLHSSACLRPMLDLLQMITESCQETRIGNTTVHVPDCEHTVELAIEQQARETTRVNLMRLCRVFLREAVKVSAVSTEAMLQDYLVRWTDLDGLTGHVGRSMAVEMGTLATSQSSGQDVGTSAFVTGLEIKAKYLGEAHAVYALLPELGGSDISQDRLSEHFCKQLEQFATQSVVDDKDARTLKTILFRAAALMVEQMSGNEKMDHTSLLHLLCWVPIQCWTRSTLEAGVFAWHWTLAALPNIERQMMTELLAAWSWTAEAGYGMFSSKGSSVDPHRVWLSFLFDRLDVVQYRSQDQMDMLVQMVHKSLSPPVQLSRNPRALGPRFRLLVLALRLLNGQHVGADNERILRTRVYSAALDWFMEPHSLKYSSRIEDLQSDIAVVAALHDALGHEREMLRSRVNESQTFSEALDQGTSNAIHLHTLVAPRQTRRTGSSIAPSVAMQRGSEALRSLSRRRRMLMLLLRDLIGRLCAWGFPQKSDVAGRVPAVDEQKYAIGTVSSTQWRTYANLAWSINPRLAIELARRFPSVAVLRADVVRMVQENPMVVAHIPSAVYFLVTEESVAVNSECLQHLLFFQSIKAADVIMFLWRDWGANMYVSKYALNVLSGVADADIIFFIPQLVQALRYDAFGGLFDFLLERARRSQQVAHQLIWNIQSYEEDKSDFVVTARKLRQSIIDGFAASEREHFEREFSFFDEVTQLSGILKPLPTKDARTEKLRGELKKITIPRDDKLYLPSNPKSLVREFVHDTATPLQSHAKVPILVVFRIVEDDEEEPVERPQACIFKVGDDVRQDMLALQIIRQLQVAFQSVDLDLYLFPYRVVATSPGCGIIEVVPNTKSRAELGRLTDGSMYEYFLARYGPAYSPRFRKAQKHFIESVAAYSVAAYILQMKDRHNGNILVDREGHVVHIDFGFLFDIAPGGNIITFERSPFKLTKEMIQIMGGGPKAEPFRWFMDLCVRAFLAARPHMDAIVSLAALMLDAGFPCFNGIRSLNNLRARFVPTKTDREAAKYMLDKIDESYDRYSTLIYDKFQAWQNGYDY